MHEANANIEPAKSLRRRQCCSYRIQNERKTPHVLGSNLATTIQFSCCNLCSSTRTPPMPSNLSPTCWRLGTRRMIVLLRCCEKTETNQWRWPKLLKPANDNWLIRPTRERVCATDLMQSNFRLARIHERENFCRTPGVLVGFRIWIHRLQIKGGVFDFLRPRLDFADGFFQIAKLIAQRINLLRCVGLAFQRGQFFLQLLRLGARPTAVARILLASAEAAFRRAAISTVQLRSLLARLGAA